MQKRFFAVVALAPAAYLLCAACGGASGGDLLASATDAAAQPTQDGSPNPNPQADGGGDSQPSSPRSSADVDFIAPVFADNMMLQVDFIVTRVPDPNCTTTTSGGCTLSRCPTGSTGSTTTYASAGNVTVSGGSPSMSMTASPLSNGTYATANANWPAAGRPFSGGEDVRVTAQGGTVPAFTFPSTGDAAPKFPLVLLLSQPTVDTPPTGSTATATVNRNQDLALAWTRGAQNVRLFAQGGGTNGNQVVSLSCDIDSLPGQATLSSDLLSALPSQTQLRIFTVGSYVSAAGQWDVMVRIATDVATPDKKAGVTLVLQ